MTQKKTITVRWNYSEFLAAIDAIIAKAGADKTNHKTISGSIDEIRKYAMAHSKVHLKTAQKPAKYADKDKKNKENGCAVGYAERNN